MESVTHTVAAICTRPLFIAGGMLTSFFWFVSGIPHQGYIPSYHAPKRHALILEVNLIIKYLRHRRTAALGGVH